jgi:hypothetical protein
VIVAFCLWLALASAGFVVATRYEKSPGELADAPLGWPVGSPIPPPNGRPVLVMFAHPRCPCTLASVDELERIAAKSRDRLDIQVVVYADPALGEGWERCTTWNRAAAVPGVRVWSDPGGRIAALFGARTSGQVLYYSARGSIEFRGGITAARGHAGDSDGKSAILGLAFGKPARTDVTSVFGCPLTSDADGPARRGERR